MLYHLLMNNAIAAAMAERIAYRVVSALKLNSPLMLLTRYFGFSKNDVLISEYDRNTGISAPICSMRCIAFSRSLVLLWVYFSIRFIVLLCFSSAGRGYWL